MKNDKGQDVYLPVLSVGAPEEARITHMEHYNELAAMVREAVKLLKGGEVDNLSAWYGVVFAVVADKTYPEVMAAFAASILAGNSKTVEEYITRTQAIREAVKHCTECSLTEPLVEEVVGKGKTEPSNDRLSFDFNNTQWTQFGKEVKEEEGEK